MATEILYPFPDNSNTSCRTTILRTKNGTPFIVPAEFADRLRPYSWYMLQSGHFARAITLRSRKESRDTGLPRLAAEWLHRRIMEMHLGRKLKPRPYEEIDHMGTLRKPARTTYFVAHGPNVTHTGITKPNQVTVTGQPLFETAADENEYLGLLAPVATAFPPLPPMGTQLNQGEIYLWGAIAVMVRQSHIRTEHDPDTVPALFIVHRLDDSIDWIAGEQVYKGTQRTFDSVLYEAIQPHVTQSDWTPPAVPALWKVVEEQGGGGTTWVDTGVTITQLVGAGVYRVSGVPTLTLNQAIRLGDLQAGETVFTGYWPATGTPSDYIKISPHVAAANGAKVWKWA